MSPVAICFLFVFILISILIGIYIGINIRYFFLQREYKREYQSRSKNVLTYEERQILKESHKEEARQKKIREKAKDKREKQRKKEERGKRRKEKQKPDNRLFKIFPAGNEKKPHAKKEYGFLTLLKSQISEKDKSVNLKDRIPDDTESYTSMVCTMDGDEETSARVKENRTSQEIKYEYTGQKKKKKHQ